MTEVSDYAAEYDAWHEEWHRQAIRVLDNLDTLRDETRAWAAGITRDKRYGKAKRDEAWARVRWIEQQLDPAGIPIDRSRRGRAAFENSWRLATGMPWTHPDDLAWREVEQQHREKPAGHHTHPHLDCLECIWDQWWIDDWATVRTGRRSAL